jgi:hypothetical protein
MNTNAKPKVQAQESVAKKELNLDEFLESSEYFYTPPLKSVSEVPTEKELLATFPSIRNFNQKLDVDQFKDEKFFVIRSNNVDDIHKVG